jgi:cytochrome c biogenesis protein
LFAPTESLHGTQLSSSFPALNKPAVARRHLRGDAGLDTGRPQSIFDLDPRLIGQGRQNKEARVNLGVGEQTRLADGTTSASTAPCRSSTCSCPTTPLRSGCWCFALTMMGGCWSRWSCGAAASGFG